LIFFTKNTAYSKLPPRNSTKEAIIKSAIKVTNSIKSIIYQSLKNTMKESRNNVNLMASLGMRMSSPNKKIPGKVGYSLI